MSEEEFGGLGFAPGSVMGVRSFDVDKFGRLTGIHYKSVWQPGENEAECLRSQGDQWSITLNSLSRSFLASTYYSGGSRQQFTLGDIPISAPVPPVSHAKRGRGKKSSIPASPQPSPDKPAPPQPQDSVAVITGGPVVPEHNFETCRCGFYGYFDGSDDYHAEAKITAVVEAYGETVIGTRGFRAMKARIVAIRVAPDVDGITGSVARKVSNNYRGVPMFEDFDQMVAAFPPDVSLEPSPDTDPDFWTR